MKNKWLNKQNNKNLIVFFNGWGMDEKIINHLNSGNYDVITFYDYRNLDTENFDFSQYEKKYLIAWSMGVYICNHFYEQLKNFDKFIAVNGTQKPIDDTFGIPIKIYDLTVENFCELSNIKFMKKISSDVNMKDYCSRTTEELKSELISIKNYKIENHLHFNKAYISLNDKIIPAKNQQNWWNKNGIEYKELNMGHYIFDKYSNWSNLLC